MFAQPEREKKCEHKWKEWFSCGPKLGSRSSSGDGSGGGNIMPQWFNTFYEISFSFVGVLCGLFFSFLFFLSFHISFGILMLRNGQPQTILWDVARTASGERTRWRSFRADNRTNSWPLRDLQIAYIVSDTRRARKQCECMGLGLSMKWLALDAATANGPRKHVICRAARKVQTKYLIYFHTNFLSHFGSLPLKLGGNGAPEAFVSSWTIVSSPNRNWNRHKLHCWTRSFVCSLSSWAISDCLWSFLGQDILATDSLE